MVYIPKQQILTRFKRYKNLNESRLQHALAVMNNDSRFILSIVPVLLHYNHINLPGYRLGDIPYGIDLFVPNEQQSQYIHSLLTPDSPPLKEPEQRAILGLYAMGSTSSLGQSDSSDLDIWVCVKSSLDDQHRHALQDKCRFISNYVKSQGVELNLFVTPEDRFTNFQPDSLDEENCGSAQNLFLLDEFYRTSIRLCGRYIIWYLISNREEYYAYDEYVDFLLNGKTDVFQNIETKNQDILKIGGEFLQQEIKESKSLNQEPHISEQNLDNRSLEEEHEYHNYVKYDEQDKSKIPPANISLEYGNSKKLAQIQNQEGMLRKILSAKHTSLAIDNSHHPNFQDRGDYSLKSNSAVRTLRQVQANKGKRTLKDKLGYLDFSNNEQVIKDTSVKNNSDVTPDEIKELERTTGASYVYKNVDVDKENLKLLDNANEEISLEPLQNQELDNYIIQTKEDSLEQTLVDNSLDEDLANVQPLEQDIVQSQQIYKVEDPLSDKLDEDLDPLWSSYDLQQMDKTREFTEQPLAQNVVVQDCQQTDLLFSEEHNFISNDSIDSELTDSGKGSFKTLASFKRRTLNLLFPSSGGATQEIDLSEDNSTKNADSEFKEPNSISRVNSFAAAMGVVQMPFMGNNYQAELDFNTNQDKLFSDPYVDQDYIQLDLPEQKTTLPDSLGKIKSHFVIKRTKTNVHSRNYKNTKATSENEQVTSQTYSNEEHLINVLSFGESPALNTNIVSPLANASHSSYIASFHDSRVSLVHDLSNKTDDQGEKSSYSFIHNDEHPLSEKEFISLDAETMNINNDVLNAHRMHKENMAIPRSYQNQNSRVQSNIFVNNAEPKDNSAQVNKQDSLSYSYKNAYSQHQDNNIGSDSKELHDDLDSQTQALNRYVYSGFGRVLTPEESQYMAKVDCFEPGNLPLNKDEWFDFGSITHSSPNEYFGSGLWLLYKAIDSPFKVVLKILLMEAYANDYPNTNLLCSELKDYMLSHDGYSIDLDAYYLMYLKVSHYLQNQLQDQRLTLMRKCFYLKIFLGLNTNCPYNTTDFKLKRKLLTKFNQRWGWSDKFVQEIESVSSWKIDQVRKFSQDVYNSLLKSYQSLLLFSVRHGIEYAITSDDAGILSRKLYAAFDRYPGKIAVLASSFTTNLEERDLCFIYPSEHSLCRKGWHLYAAAPDNLALLNTRVCYIGSRLSEVVTWACFNGVLKSRTTCHVLSSTSKVSPLKIKLLSNDIVRVLKPRRGRVSEVDLQRTERMKGCVVILNLEQDETAFFDKNLVDIDYGSTLCCSRQRLCLVGSIDMVILNSWGELRSFAMPSGEEGVVELLATLLRVIGNSTTTADEAIDLLNDVEVCCYSDDYQDLIKYDLISTIRQVFNCLSSANSSEYVFDVGRNTYVARSIDRRGVKINRKNVFGSDEFDISVLSRYGMRPEYSLQVPPVVDRYATAGILQYFFSPVSPGCWDIYIINERNEVSTYSKYEGSRAALVNEINRFYTLQSGGKMNHLSRFNLPQYFVLSKDFSSIHPFTIRTQTTE